MFIIGLGRKIENFGRSLFQNEGQAKKGHEGLFSFRPFYLYGLKTCENFKVTFCDQVFTATDNIICSTFRALIQIHQAS